jgi:hypothetical protein
MAMVVGRRNAFFHVLRGIETVLRAFAQRLKRLAASVSGI